MCKRDKNVLCILPDKNQRCDACVIRRKRCLWNGEGIPKGGMKKEESKEVEVTEDAKRRPKRPLRTMKAQVPSQKKTCVESSEEVEEAVMESSKRRKIEVEKATGENSGEIQVLAMHEEALLLARQGAS